MARMATEESAEVKSQDAESRVVLPLVPPMRPWPSVKSVANLRIGAERVVIIGQGNPLVRQGGYE